jgi:hypothetical protein
MRVLLSRIVCLVTIVWVAAITGLHAQQAPLTSAALTPVPRLIWFNSTFRPADNLPVAPVENITVAVYREREGGDAIWQETQNVATDAVGRYSLLIGSTFADGMPLALFTSGEPCWIGITVNRPGEVEQPRVHQASVPYALKAADAETLGGLPASAYLRAPAAEHAGVVVERESSGAAMPTDPDVTMDAVVQPGTTNFLAKYVNGADVGISAVYEAGGAVGIGTTTPFDAMHVRFTNTGGTATGLAVQNLGNTATSYSGMLFYDQNGALGQFQGFNNSTHEYRINNIASGGKINFMIGNSSKFLVANNGNIGVSVPVPGSKLDVAGAVNVSTQYNIGGSRMLGVGSGIGNLFVGFDAGMNSSSGSYQNAFFGLSAGKFNTSGGNNAFFAYNAGVFNTLGTGNSFFGASAGQNNTEGNQNAFFGLGAGFNNSDGDYNAFVGTDAGLSNTTESNNTFIGSFSDGAATVVNATALGYQAQVTRSNSLVLGTADTNVGIGTTAPEAKLHVAGGSIYIANPNSLIITSPNGTCWFITVSDAGALSSIAVACP